MPKPDKYAFTLPNGWYSLLTNDGKGLAKATQQKLKQEGFKSIVLNFPGQDKSGLENVIDLVEVSDASILSALDEARAHYGRIGVFIHLHPAFKFEPKSLLSKTPFQQEQQILKTVFFIAKHLKQDLNELGENQRSVFMTLTQMDGNLGLNNNGQRSPLGGAFPGLVKSLNLEWAPVFCRADRKSVV